MNKATFIAEIRKREFLWNRKIVQMHAEEKRKFEDLWTEVGNIFGISGDMAKRRWRSIRDQFYKLIHFKKVPVYTSGDTYYIKNEDKPCWQYFDDLTFLLSKYKPEQNIVNLEDSKSIIDIRCSVDSDSCASISYEQDNDISLITEIKEEEPELSAPVQIPVQISLPLMNSLPPLAMVKPQLPVPSFTSIKRVYTLQQADDLDLPTPPDEQYTRCPSKKVALEPSSNKIESKANEVIGDENENFRFFHSLLPFMKKLDPVQQLRVRMRIQECLLKQLGEIR